jgi:hypothetical protein
MRYILVICFLLLCTVSVSARDIAGVSIAERIDGTNGVSLVLNGAGVRSKLFFKIYIAELYLENPGTDVATILADEGQRKMVMHFLYNEVDKEKLVSAWNEGFTGNLSNEEVEQLAPRIDTFNEMFTTVKAGDVISLDYLPGIGTKVTVAGNEKGVIAGKDFADGLFAIWLGEKPVTADLKKALLNYNM